MPIERLIARAAAIIRTVGLERKVAFEIFFGLFQKGSVEPISKYNWLHC